LIDTLLLWISQISSIPNTGTLLKIATCNNLQLGWEKLDKYYRFINDSSAYVAAIALHPQYKWRWIEKKGATI
jgi:hypothetical protein